MNIDGINKQEPIHFQSEYPISKQKKGLEKYIPSEVNFQKDKKLSVKVNNMTSDPVIELADLREETDKIEKTISRLEEQKDDTALAHEAFQGAQGWIDYGGQIGEILAAGAEFIKEVYPSKIANHPSIGHLIDLRKITVPLGTYVEALNLGLGGLALIYKIRAIKNAEEIVQELIQKYESANEKIPVEVEKWKSELVKLREKEVVLKLEMEKVPLKATEHGLKSVKNSFGMMDFFLNFTPLSRLIPHAQHLSAAFGMVTSFLGAALGAISLGSAINAKETFSTWVNGYKQSEKESISVVKDGELLTNQKGTAKPPQLKSHLEYTNELDSILRKCKDIPELKAAVRDCGMAWDPIIRHRKQFFRRWNNNPAFKDFLVQSYINTQKAYLELPTVIAESKNLWEKREAEAKLKVMQLRFQADTLDWRPLFSRRSSFEEIRPQWENTGIPFPTDGMLVEGTERSEPTKEDYVRFCTNLEKENPQQFKSLLNLWVNAKPLDERLRLYTDHQATISQTIKNSLKLLVPKQHELQNIFLKFKIGESSVMFSLAVIGFVIASVLACVALAVAPAPGAFIAAIVVSALLSAASLGLMAGGLYMNSKFKHNQTNLKTYLEAVEVKLLYSKIRHSIQRHIHRRKKAKLEKLAKELIDTHNPVKGMGKHPKIDKYKEAKKALNDSERKMDQWEQRIEKLEIRLKERAWKDFSKYANLSSSANFDTLKAFREAFSECDLDKLDEDTKTFLRVQLGVDLQDLKNEMKKDPDAVKKVLQNFFSLDDVGLVGFFEKQHARQQAGLI